ncbi:serine/threonine-protein kinase Nek1-like [Ipomoea triloba]|uniref:serine/threonine-protein kinase Nek1-like n=1 Tax=Ipomoea triloba TaxID=35885 RepID=UPI00125CE2C6|nr:serine/threonine-protein kinase Nek1-like [Ipomoea triloba]
MENYEILEQIGKGSFGSALLVRHRQEKKKYVLKKIRLARQTERTRRSAHQEMELIAKARNPYIVEYKDSWVEKGCYVCIILGYCEGGDMGEALKRANGELFSEEKLCKWLVQLLIALDYLHTNHILHRDVKCSNIFLTKDHDIRLGDFGLAKVLSSGDLASSVVGTPCYMCPELLADIPYGSKSDIWSLGCCMYEMAAHRPAFTAFDMQGLINKINKCIMAPLPTTYSGAFRGIVKSMLRKNPEHRPNAADLLRHPHLQPYVPRIHRALESTRQSTRPVNSTGFDNVKRTRFVEPEISSDRALKPGVSESELDFPCLSLKAQDDMISSNKNLSKPSVESPSSIPKFSESPSLISSNKTSAAPRKESPPLKISTPGSTRELLPVSHTPVSKRSQSARRSSPRVSNKPAKLEPRRKHNVISLLCSVDSLDVSVNAPRMDKMVEFPISTPKTPSTTSSDSGGDRLITKEMCIVPKPDGNGRECSKGNHRTGELYSDSCRQCCRFDTSSFQQRAEALEGVLEFSAQLMQQERFEELAVLLKPFGPEKVSPRETAIWLTKSLKNTAQPCIM